MSFNMNESSPELSTHSPSSNSSSNLPSKCPSPATLDTALPIHGRTPVYPGLIAASKKSHARKQPAGHIPRPRNAFIIFRCDFVKQKRVPESVENDHRNISRIVGRIWQEMSDAEKFPWVEMAQREKEQHAKKYPGYRYTPVGSHSSSKVRFGRKGKASDGGGEAERKKSPRMPQIQSLPRRPSSCPPPGSTAITPLTGFMQDSYGSPLTTRDDLGRRLSRTTVYLSESLMTQGIHPTAVSSAGAVGPTFPSSAGAYGPTLFSNSYGPVASPAGDLQGLEEVSVSNNLYRWFSPAEQHNVMHQELATQIPSFIVRLDALA